MGRLLRGELPPGGKCDLKTLAAESGVTLTGFYPKKNRDGNPRPGPYQHLAEGFERRLAVLQQAGEIVDPRAGQIERLQAQVAELKDRVTKRDEALAELTAFKTLAVSQIAAQHDETQRLREQVAAPRQRPQAPGQPRGYGAVRVVQLSSICPQSGARSWTTGALGGANAGHDCRLCVQSRPPARSFSRLLGHGRAIGSRISYCGVLA
ncbi:hypothetical protein GCM10027072_10140 [Streptomyces bullii]